MAAGPVGVAYVGGRIVPLASARVPLVDRGLTLGDGVFETMRAIRGKVVRWEAHRSRLVAGLHAMRLDEGGVHAFAAAVRALVEAGERLGDALAIRVSVTSGAGALGDAPQVQVTGTCRPHVGTPARMRGLKTILAATRRDPTDPLCGVKHLGYAAAALARREARAAGADDALVANTAGRLAEATTANVFVVCGTMLHAPGPEEGALPGVTRDAVLEWARAQGYAIRPKASARDLASSDAAWLSSTLRGVVPLSAFDPGRGPHAVGWSKTTWGAASRRVVQQVRRGVEVLLRADAEAPR